MSGHTLWRAFCILSFVMIVVHAGIMYLFSTGPWIVVGWSPALAVSLVGRFVAKRRRL